MLNDGGKVMRKILVLIMTVATSMIFILSLSACENAKYAGTYEMISISGQMTMNGQTTEITKDLYEYYRIVLEEDGSAKVQSKGKANTTAVEMEGSWEYTDGKIILKSSNSGINTIEEMLWEKGKITYSASQSGAGYTIEMDIVLQKK